MQESRLFKILYYLLEKGRATAPELAEKFEVSSRTIYRDIDALSGAGIPLYTEAGRNGGIYLMEHFVLDRIVLTDREKSEILTACKAPARPGTKPGKWRLKNYRRFSGCGRKTGTKWTFPDGAARPATATSLNC